MHLVFIQRNMDRIFGWLIIQGCAAMYRLRRLIIRGFKGPAEKGTTCFFRAALRRLMKTKTANGSGSGMVGSSEEAAEEAVAFLRRRLMNVGGPGPLLVPGVEQNSRQLQEFLTETIERGFNNSMLLLGPRGCGKSKVVERVFEHLQLYFPDRVSFVGFKTWEVHLNGLLHADDRCALKEIAEQLCMEHHLLFSKTAAFNENLHFLMTMLKECALSHKAVIFILEEFDLFAQRTKQRLLYNILDAMQSTLTQAAVVGLSCRLDADQLLEKRVRSRFSHRKLLFLPPSLDDIFGLLHDSLMLPVDGSFKDVEFAKHFNNNTSNVLKEESLQELIGYFMALDLSPRHILDLAHHEGDGLNILFKRCLVQMFASDVFLEPSYSHQRTRLRALCNLDQEGGLLSVANFKAAIVSHHRQPKLEALENASVLELYLLVCMKRLEGKGKETHNFNAVFEEYEQLQEAHRTSDHYSREVSRRAFEHLLERELVAFADGRGRSDAFEFRPVELLIVNYELEEGLKLNPVCPTILRQWFSHTTFK